MKINLAMLTMNAGGYGLDTCLRWTLKNHKDHFNRIFIVDGFMTENAHRYYQHFENVVAIDSPFEDNWVNQYKTWFDAVPNDEFVLYLDEDEICSPSLLEYIGSKEFENDARTSEIIRLPNVLHLTEDYINYFACEEFPDDEWKEEIWTKNILLKKTDNIYFRHFGSHVIPETKSNKYIYRNKPYFHMKSIRSFIENDVLQSYISPEGQGFKLIHAARYRQYTKQYKTMKEYKEAIQSGKVAPVLCKFAQETMTEYDNAVSRLAYMYFHLYDNEGKYPDVVKDKLEQSVQSQDKMEIYRRNIKRKNGIEIK